MEPVVLQDLKNTMNAAVNVVPHFHFGRRLESDLRTRPAKHRYPGVMRRIILDVLLRQSPFTSGIWHERLFRSLIVICSCHRRFYRLLPLGEENRFRVLVAKIVVQPRFKITGSTSLPCSPIFAFTKPGNSYGRIGTITSLRFEESTSLLSPIGCSNRYL